MEEKKYLVIEKFYILHPKDEEKPDNCEISGFNLSGLKIVLFWKFESLEKAMQMIKKLHNDATSMYYTDGSLGKEEHRLYGSRIWSTSGDLMWECDISVTDGEISGNTMKRE